jgi:hypothetical protein
VGRARAAACAWRLAFTGRPLPQNEEEP